jgi:hypothetical protein
MGIWWSAVLFHRRTYDLIVTFIRPGPNRRIGPSFLIQILKFGREARYCPSRGLLPQRPSAGSLAEYVKNGIRFALPILLGFLRHRRESLNNEGGGKMRRTASSPVHYSMLPSSGYSLTGCSPAEPVSASPDNFMSAKLSAGLLLSLPR